GDSIKSIQIASRMKKEGYSLEIKDLFNNPTIAKLAPLVKKNRRIPPQTPVTGTIPLTPIQETFFRQKRNAPHHYNQAVMLRSKPGESFEKETVEKIFTKIQEQHDALRITYKHTPQGIIQTNHGNPYPLDLQEYELRGKNKEEAVKALEAGANQIQAGISLEKGPLMKLGLFHRDDGDRLLVVIHHLVIDGVSWRILFEDIDTLYRRHKENQPLELPHKSDSFKQWAEKLRTYAQSNTMLKEKEYWK
ncbi:MAG: non-ribosomal peptide synthetase, partial [bacterium]|nr:non-ribosomal peptide synthetase [bacterium]